MKWYLEVNRVETYNRKKKIDSYQIGECQHEQIQCWHSPKIYPGGGGTAGGSRE